MDGAKGKEQDQEQQDLTGYTNSILQELKYTEMHKSSTN